MVDASPQPSPKEREEEASKLISTRFRNDSYFE
jgi:hypothetical protein